MIEKSSCYTISKLTKHDTYLFKEGSHYKLYEKLGSHMVNHEGVDGVLFAVWAPNAQSISVIGDFNTWDTSAHPLNVRDDDSGIWEVFVPGVTKGSLYKYHIVSKFNNYQVDKRDPHAYFCEIPPKTASIIWDLEYQWNDSSWMKNRHKNNSLESPFSVYELHFGSWKRVAGEENRFLTYREMADQLVPYLLEMGFTHVEFLPLMAHPFYGSWGYQTIGYFAPTSRYGTPQDLMYLIDALHQHGIGVIFDWVPSHFPSDGHALAYFDGTHLYEHSDPKKGFHPDWKTYIFNYGRNETRAFLISSALFWLDKYHIDGIRVDGVASMLYLDYSRKEGEWIPNRYGGRENIEAVDFLKLFNSEVYRNYPDVQTIAEESTAWPMVSRPTFLGGLGFGMKWNMGWMHDTLSYFSKDPIYRKHHHNQLTFSLLYAFTENFMLSLSHDEIVYGKGSLLGKMPGDDWQKFSSLRLLYGYMFAHPGKKLLFMGGEFAQRDEWNHEKELSWNLLEYQPHANVQRWIRELNRFYREEPALYADDFSADGFEWVDGSDQEKSIVSFIRKDPKSGNQILVICNFTPNPRVNYKVGVPKAGFWKEVLNSDAKEYGGSGHGNMGGVETAPVPYHGRYYSLSLTVPPLGAIFFKPETV
ncbi:1,4-alpha-glucan branching protein GlgB [Candidatus Omnitrophota bacterium]